MNTFITSDLHLGHANIIVYADRPWLKVGDLLEEHTNGKPKWRSQDIANERAEKMTNALIKNINMRCKKEDTLICVGDFCCRGNEKDVAGVKTKAEEWESLINPKLIHVIGNHDKNNSVKGCIENMVCRLNNKWVAWVSHCPPWSRGDIVSIPKYCNVFLCGHVHNKWKFQMFNDMPVVNVGVDVNNYNPITKDEIVGQIERYIRENKNSGTVVPTSVV